MSKLTLTELLNLVQGEKYFRVEDTTLTICVLILNNNITVTGESNCIDPSEFDAETGRQEARKAAINKLWELEGYARKRICNLGITKQVCGQPPMSRHDHFGNVSKPTNILDDIQLGNTISPADGYSIENHFLNNRSIDISVENSEAFLTLNLDECQGYLVYNETRVEIFYATLMAVRERNLYNFLKHDFIVTHIPNNDVYFDLGPGCGLSIKTLERNINNLLIITYYQGRWLVIEVIMEGQMKFKLLE